MSHEALKDGETSWPVFHERWWLDAVAPESWREALVECHGKVVGRMPYVLRRRRGRVLIEMPPLTQVLGPWVLPRNEGHTSRLSREKDVMSALIAQLPPFDGFVQHCDFSMTNWLPFYWSGFSQTTRYTYQLSFQDVPEDCLLSFERSRRNKIRKAHKLVGIEEDLGAGEMYRILAESIRERGGQMTYGEELFRRVYEGAYSRKQGKSLFAVDADGRVHAAALIVWNARAAYLLVTALPTVGRSSDALSLVVYEAIKFSRPLASCFDFEGSMGEAIESAFREYGARQVPYFQLRKTNALGLRIAEDVAAWRSMAWRKLRRPGSGRQ